MKAISTLRTRFVAIFALLLMALSVVSGMTPQLQVAGTGSLVTASFAGQGPNDLWVQGHRQDGDLYPDHHLLHLPAVLGR